MKTYSLEEDKEQKQEEEERKTINKEARRIVDNLVANIVTPQKGQGPKRPTTQNQNEQPIPTNLHEQIRELKNSGFWQEETQRILEADTKRTRELENEYDILQSNKERHSFSPNNPFNQSNSPNNPQIQLTTTPQTRSNEDHGGA